MKLRESFRFPYPVLTETSSDYVNDQIDLSISVEERAPDSALKLTYELQLASPTLQQELRDQTCRGYISVVCLDAYYNEFFPMNSMTGEVSVAGGQLFGRVEVRGVIVRLSGGVLEASGLQADYDSNKFELPAGAVVAWTQPQRFAVGMEKLAPMESIFKLAREDKLDAGTFGVSVDDEYITVLAPEKLLETIHAMREKPKARAIALNAIYVPALMSVLQIMKDSDTFAERRWHRVISGKAQALGVNIKGGSVLDSAQKLMRAPAARLTSFMEKFS